MSKSIEELTTEIVVAAINVNPLWVYYQVDRKVDTTPLVTLIKDVHKTLEELKERTTV